MVGVIDHHHVEVLMERKTKNSFLARVMFLSLFLLLAVPVLVYAEGPDLTEIFTTKAFQGSWEVIYQFNWLGQIMNYIISFFCLLGLFLIMFSRMISLLYLSSKDLWNNVDEIKSAATGAWFGFPALGKNVFNSNHGGGVDSIVSFFLGLLPNVKNYSDYRNGGALSNLSEDDNAFDYILKTAPATIVLIFFFAIGFSGTLSQAYGTIVSGMATFADNVVSINLDKYVDEFFKMGDNPTFVLGEDGTIQGKTQKSVAKALYKEAVVASGATDKQSKAQLAASAEQIATNYITPANVGGKAGIAINTDADWDRIKVSIKTSASSTGSAQTQVIPLQEILPNYQGQTYLHVSFSAGSGGENYFGN